MTNTCNIETKEIEVQKSLKEISESLLRVDRKVHNQYTEDNLKKVRDDIQEYAKQAEKNV